MQRNFKFFGRVDLHKTLHTTRTDIIKKDLSINFFKLTSIKYPSLRYQLYTSVLRLQRYLRTLFGNRYTWKNTSTSYTQWVVTLSSIDNYFQVYFLSDIDRFPFFLLCINNLISGSGLFPSRRSALTRYVWLFISQKHIKFFS